MDGFLGEITLFTGTFEPENWAYCDGRVLSVKTAANANLYKILGNRFGGSAHFEIPTFALPNMPDPFPNGHYIICINGVTLEPNG